MNAFFWMARGFGVCALWDRYVDLVCLSRTSWRVYKRSTPPTFPWMIQSSGHATEALASTPDETASDTSSGSWNRTNATRLDFYSQETWKRPATLCILRIYSGFFDGLALRIQHNGENVPCDSCIHGCAHFGQQSNSFLASTVLASA